MSDSSRLLAQLFVVEIQGGRGLVRGVADQVPDQGVLTPQGTARADDGSVVPRRVRKVLPPPNRLNGAQGPRRGLLRLFGERACDSSQRILDNHPSSWLAHEEASDRVRAGEGT